MTREQRRAIVSGLVASGALAALIFVGSRNLRHVDAALVGYTFACIFAAFSVAYRYSMWLQRPPTRQYWRRGWQAFLQRGHRWESMKKFAMCFVGVFLMNLFIWKRSRSRAAAHMLIMWGCILAGMITFPLVFGWIHFETVRGNMSLYQVYVFGFPAGTFPHNSILGEFIFHGLVWSALLVTPGVLLAFRRRLRDHGAAVLQNLREDLMPLILLFSVSVTGLFLTISYTWMKGYGYEFLSLLHAVTVISTLLWLPFGKLFHIFQRPAQLGVKFYKDVGQQEQVACARCRQPYASKMQVEDLIEVERQLGYRYELPEDPAGHYQRICPACRRKMMALAQGRLWMDQPPMTFDGH